MLRAYGVTIFITAVGTILGLFLLTMTAYVISRQDFKYRNKISFFFYFTTLFNGGMISTYIFYIQYLHLKDNFLALILPGIMNVFYLLIMRSFVNTVPTALIESAKIDGAGEFRIFVQIVLPLLKSGLATIGLFMALGYWNDWYNAMLYQILKQNSPCSTCSIICCRSSEALAANVPARWASGGKPALQLFETGHGSGCYRSYHSLLSFRAEVLRQGALRSALSGVEANRQIIEKSGGTAMKKSVRIMCRYCWLWQ